MRRWLAAALWVVLGLALSVALTVGTYRVTTGVRPAPPAAALVERGDRPEHGSDTLLREESNG